MEKNKRIFFDLKGCLLRGVNGDIYLLEGPVGLGGCATVYRAIRKDDGRVVALKIRHEWLGADNLKRESDARKLFVLEIQRTQLFVSDSGIVQYLGHGHDPAYGIDYVVLEFLEGQTLQQILEQKRSLTYRTVLMIAWELAHALQSAHQARIAHCDVKPENVLIAKINEHARVKLIDFGISHHMDAVPRQTSKGVRLGSVPLAPEQLTVGPDGCFGGRNPPTDISKLAYIVYLLLGGTPDQLVLSSCRELVFVQLASYQDVASLVYKCLARQEADRPTAAGFIEFLRPLREQHALRDIPLELCASAGQRSVLGSNETTPLFAVTPSRSDSTLPPSV